MTDCLYANLHRNVWYRDFAYPVISSWISPQKNIRRFYIRCFRGRSESAIAYKLGYHTHKSVIYIWLVHKVRLSCFHKEFAYAAVSFCNLTRLVCMHVIPASENYSKISWCRRYRACCADNTVCGNSYVLNYWVPFQTCSWYKWIPYARCVCILASGVQFCSCWYIRIRIVSN